MKKLKAYIHGLKSKIAKSLAKDKLLHFIEGLLYAALFHAAGINILLIPILAVLLSAVRELADSPYDILDVAAAGLGGLYVSVILML